MHERKHKRCLPACLPTYSTYLHIVTRLAHHNAGFVATHGFDLRCMAAGVAVGVLIAQSRTFTGK